MARYTQVPTQPSEEEMEAAFEGSDDEPDDGIEDISRPLIQAHQHQDSTSHPLQMTSDDPQYTPAHYTPTLSTSGSYNFEYDYAGIPPPGSPPRPSALAMPNSYGNTNGLIPTDTPARPMARQPGLFRRAFGAILSTHHAQDTRGGGRVNDGVFGNVVAKPGGPSPVRGLLGASSDDPRLSPEDAQKEAPPSYQTAQADAVPPYWENTILAPSGPMDGDMIIEGLPVGSVFSFMWNLLVSVSFQFVGFLLTFLLHTTHAAKFGSRAGLGITFIQYGFYMRSSDAVVPVAGDDPSSNSWSSWAGTSSDSSPVSVRALVPRLLGTLQAAPPLDGSNTTTITQDLSEPNGGEIFGGASAFTPNDWFSFMMMTLGWFILITSFLGFWRVKRWERNVQRSVMIEREPTPDELSRNAHALRNIERAFGMAAYTLSPYGDTREQDVEANDHHSSLPPTTSGANSEASIEDGSQGRRFIFALGR